LHSPSLDPDNEAHLKTLNPAPGTTRREIAAPAHRAWRGSPGSAGISAAIGAWLERWLFGSGLVFNQVWEDPLVDRQALAPTVDDVVLGIASAGDNLLALLLEGPRKIYAVDLNPAQIHLLRLKVAAIQQLDYPDFWHLFSLAPAPRAGQLYHEHLRNHLPAETQEFWDAHLILLERGLSYAGVFGRALWLLRSYLKLVCGESALQQLFHQDSLGDQAEHYRRRIHTPWWNPVARPLAAVLPVLVMFGAHPRQAWRVRGGQFAHSLAQGIYQALTTSPIQNNFLWQQALLGHYLTPPEYARPENFSRLKANISRVEMYIGRAQDLLRSLPPESLTAINLLDALDWLEDVETLDLWTLIRRAAAPGARVLFRSIDPTYCLPGAASTGWRDQTDPRWARAERTGVYAKVCLYVLA
jgi:S-adenosylmethionine-diacylglycerol 3-amino-3-carboxypropyl transferase